MGGLFRAVDAITEAVRTHGVRALLTGVILGVFGVLAWFRFVPPPDSVARNAHRIVATSDLAEANADRIERINGTVEGLVLSDRRRASQMDTIIVQQRSILSGLCLLQLDVSRESTPITRGRCLQ